MDMTETTIRPWYREFWVWFILAILSMGVASGTGVLVIGIKHAPQMVTGDYQPLGKVLIDTREHAERASSLGLSAELAVGDDLAELTLRAHRIDALPDQLLLRFQHPTDAGRDVSAVARRVDAGRWQADLGSIQPPGRSRVILSDLEQTWWLAGRYAGRVAGEIGLDPEQL
ncbi:MULTISPECIES: FixH family protein [unclassified Wenzhouxiangella]|uniref:FixH family protein n=1 Tax=unclassified Wenzhouxiangella TaxID=2613841 RepID=UPI0015F29D26|nr:MULTISPECIES: FixH family protein [unclassified Wenzhouxiangella]